MFSFFKRKPPFGDKEKIQFADAIGHILQVQLTLLSTKEIPAGCKAQALGYIYGFVDAALRTIGQDMADSTVGIPVTYQVLRRVFPGAEREYMNFLSENIRDATLMTGMSYGGQQYLDFNNRKLEAPMGLARIIVESKSKA